MDTVTLDVDGEVLGGITDNPVVPDIQPEVSEDRQNPDEVGSGEAQVIGTISSAAYGGFTKILSLLTTNMGKSDVISIKEGKLSTVSGGGYLYCDLSVLFGDNDLDIIDPQYNIKLMKLITGGDEVVFVDDEPKERYLISSLVEGKPVIDIALQKPDPSMNPRITKPELGELNQVLEKIDPDLVNTIITAEKNLDSQYFIVEINENHQTGKSEIINISTDKETFKYNFADSWVADDGQELTKFKLFNPFPIAKPDDIVVELYRSESGEYWIKTSSEVGLAQIEYMEKLTPMGIFETFSL